MRRKGLNLGSNTHRIGEKGRLTQKPRHKPGMFDRLEGYDREVWLKISRKNPAGWEIMSVNMRNLKKIAFADMDKASWDIIPTTEPNSHFHESVFEPFEKTVYYLVLKAHPHKPVNA